MRRRLSVGLICFALCGAVIAGGSGAVSVGAQPRSAGTSAAAPNPIKHVVVIFQENHSFDNVLGPLCVTVLANRCHGVLVGKKHDGTSQPLSAATDLVPYVDHAVDSQVKAINGGAMNGFDRLKGCAIRAAFACYSAYQPPKPGNPGFIANVATLAQTYVISDATFELTPQPSWGSHLSFVASQNDGFTGDNPLRGTQGPGPGWGCNSKKDTTWRATPISPKIRVPACVPTRQGLGPYKSSPVKWVPTLFDTLTGAGLNFKLYTDPSGGAYNWAICPIFADCLLTNQARNMVPTSQILTDTAQGGPGLPAFSVVLPNGLNFHGGHTRTSQHNGTLMSRGDNWIGEVVQAIQNDSKDWSSTAIFLTWDDCGCFYDDVKPPTGNGVRVPMIMISPYAKLASTDHSQATFASILAFTEHVFSLPSLSNTDLNAYDYFGSFNFAAPPNLTKTHLIQQPISPALEAQVNATPEDPNDTT